MHSARNPHGSFKVYIRRSCNQGPYLDRRKVKNLSRYFHSTSVKKTILDLLSAILKCSKDSRRKDQLEKKLSEIHHSNTLDRFSKGKTAIVILKQEIQSCNNFIGIRPPKRECCKKCRLNIHDPSPSSSNIVVEQSKTSDSPKDKNSCIKSEPASTTTIISVKQETSPSTTPQSDKEAASSTSTRQSRVNIYTRRGCSGGNLLDPEKVSKLPSVLKSKNISNLSKLVLEAIVNCANDVEMVFKLVPYGGGPVSVEAKIGEFLQRRSFPHTHSRKELKTLLAQFSKSVGFCENLLSLGVPNSKRCKSCKTKRKLYSSDSDLGPTAPEAKRQKTDPIVVKELKVVIQKLPDEVVNQYLHRTITPKKKEVYLQGRKVTVIMPESKYLKTPEKELFSGVPSITEYPIEEGGENVFNRSTTPPIQVEQVSSFQFPPEFNVEEETPPLMIDDVSIAEASLAEDPLSTLFLKDNIDTSGVSELINDNEFTESVEQCERSLMVFSPKPWQSLEDAALLSKQDSENTDVVADITASATTTVATAPATTTDTSKSHSSAEPSSTTVTSRNETDLSETPNDTQSQMDIITKIVTVEKSTEVFIQNCLATSFNSENPLETAAERSSFGSDIVSNSSELDRSCGIEATSSTPISNPVLSTNQTKKLSHFSRYDSSSSFNQGSNFDESSHCPPSSTSRNPNNLMAAKEVPIQDSHPLAVPGTSIVLTSASPLPVQTATARQYSGQYASNSLSELATMANRFNSSMPLTTTPTLFNTTNSYRNQYQPAAFPQYQPMNPILNQSPQNLALQSAHQAYQAYSHLNTAFAQMNVPSAAFGDNSTYLSNGSTSITQSRLPPSAHGGQSAFFSNSGPAPNRPPVPMGTGQGGAVVQSTREAPGFTGSFNKFNQSYTADKGTLGQSTMRNSTPATHGASGFWYQNSLPRGSSVPIQAPASTTASLSNSTHALLNRMPNRFWRPLSLGAAPQQLGNQVTWYPPTGPRISEPSQLASGAPQSVFHQPYTIQQANWSSHPQYTSVTSSETAQVVSGFSQQTNARPVNVVTPQPTCNAPTPTSKVGKGTHGNSTSNGSQYSRKETPNKSNLSNRKEVSNTMPTSQSTSFQKLTAASVPTQPSLKVAGRPDKETPLFTIAVSDALSLACSERNTVPGIQSASSQSQTLIKNLLKRPPTSTGSISKTPSQKGSLKTSKTPQSSQKVPSMANRSFAAHTSQWPGSLSMSKDKYKEQSNTKTSSTGSLDAIPKRPILSIQQDLSSKRSRSDTSPHNSPDTVSQDVPPLPGQSSVLSTSRDLDASTTCSSQAAKEIAKPPNEIEKDRSSSLLISNEKMSTNTPLPKSGSEVETNVSSKEDNNMESSAVTGSGCQQPPNSRKELQTSLQSNLGALLTVLTHCEPSRIEDVKRLLMSLLKKIKSKSPITNAEVTAMTEAVGPVVKESEAFKKLLGGLSLLSSMNIVSQMGKSSTIPVTNTNLYSRPNTVNNTHAEKISSGSNSEQGSSSTTVTDSLPNSLGTSSSLQTHDSSTRIPSFTPSKDVSSSVSVEKDTQMSTVMNSVQNSSEILQKRVPNTTRLVSSSSDNFEKGTRPTNSFPKSTLDDGISQKSAGLTSVLDAHSKAISNDRYADDISNTVNSDATNEHPKSYTGTDEHQKPDFGIIDSGKVNESGKKAFQSPDKTDSVPSEVTVLEEVSQPEINPSKERQSDTYEKGSGSNEMSSQMVLLEEAEQPELSHTNRSAQSEHFSSNLSESNPSDVPQLEESGKDKVSTQVLVQDGGDQPKVSPVIDQTVSSIPTDESAKDPPQEPKICEIATEGESKVTSDDQLKVNPVKDDKVSHEIFEDSLSMKSQLQDHVDVSGVSSNSETLSSSKKTFSPTNECLPLAESLTTASQETAAKGSFGKKSDNSNLNNTNEISTSGNHIMRASVNKKTVDKTDKLSTILNSNKESVGADQSTSQKEKSYRNADSLITKKSPRYAHQTPSSSKQEIPVSQSRTILESLKSGAIPLHVRFMKKLQENNRDEQKRFNVVLKELLRKIRAELSIDLSDLLKLRTTAPKELRKTIEFKELMDIFRKSIPPSDFSDEVVDLTSEDSDIDGSTDSTVEVKTSPQESSSSDLSLCEIVNVVQNKVKTESSLEVSVAKGDTTLSSKTQVLEDKVNNVDPMETAELAKTSELPVSFSTSVSLNTSDGAQIPGASHLNPASGFPDVYKNDATAISQASMSDLGLAANTPSEVETSTPQVNAISSSSPVSGTSIPTVNGSSFVRISRDETSSNVGRNTSIDPMVIKTEVAEKVGSLAKFAADSNSSTCALSHTGSMLSPVVNKETEKSFGATVNIEPATFESAGSSSNLSASPSDLRLGESNAPQQVANTSQTYANQGPYGNILIPNSNHQNSMQSFGNIGPKNLNSGVTSMPNMNALAHPGNAAPAILQSAVPDNRYFTTPSGTEHINLPVSNPNPTLPVSSMKSKSAAHLPKPEVTISSFPDTTVLMWDIRDTTCLEMIASYQIYAIQLERNEIITQDIVSTKTWTPLGVIKSLPPPMAITLTNLREGLKSYIIVRAVDKNGHTGPFSSICEVVAEKS